MREPSGGNSPWDVTALANNALRNLLDRAYRTDPQAGTARQGHVSLRDLDGYAHNLRTRTDH